MRRKIFAIVNLKLILWIIQEAQQEKSTFVSSLMPLLTDYNFHPSVSDAISITSNIKVRTIYRPLFLFFLKDIL